MNTTPGYDQFFEQATGHPPYDYQSRLAGNDCGTTCQSQLINIPTGLGKTAAVVLAWLWNRVQLNNPQWPRRLVYCLPMRTLVEQTRDNVRGWLKKSGDLEWDKVGPHQGKVGLHILMGGEEREENPWDLYPEEYAILIGTQDMLLSRALNRGYGMSRYRWPMHFGLLNNDCLWMMDETQLMGVGLETSVQLAGFRERFGTFTHCVHWWMSATLDSARLATPEAPPVPPPLQLTDDERVLPAVSQRFTAVKRLRAADTKYDSEVTHYVAALAGEVMLAHIPKTLTLVIANTVERAQELYRALKKQSGDIPITLLHSRFRPQERRELARRVLETSGDHLVISTQVIEAGVDISARTLFTELAPWSSLIQRFGRCHRHGELKESGADIRWIDLPAETAAPYTSEELDQAKALLVQLSDVSLERLASITAPVAVEPTHHIIRPKDIRELFDTTPDVAGADLDVSRFIREGDDTDCTVFWRSGDPADTTKGATRDELCPVPVMKLSEFVGKPPKSNVWTWDTLSRNWIIPRRIIPGREYWLDARLGGYDPAIGFDRKSKTPVIPIPQASKQEEGHDDDLGTTVGIPEVLEVHTSAVVRKTERLCSALVLPASLSEALRLAAIWHDVGKAHFAFQDAMKESNPNLPADKVWAKSGVRTPLNFGDRSRFRHELASALAFRASTASSNADLVAFLIAAHHGKVRLSIRSLPDEKGDIKNPERLFVRGVWDGDELPPLDLEGQHWPAIRLSLATMQLGLGNDNQPSWLEASIELRDSLDFGPFRLAFAETLLRAADQRASQESCSK